jgi:hypothetical protein
MRQRRREMNNKDTKGNHPEPSGVSLAQDGQKE